MSKIFGESTFNLYCAAKGLNTTVKAHSYEDVLLQYGIDPDAIQVQQTDGHRVVFKYNDDTYVVWNRGF